MSITAACGKYKYCSVITTQSGGELPRSTGVGYKVKGHKGVRLRLKKAIATV